MNAYDTGLANARTLLQSRGFSVRLFDETSSTNDEAIGWAKAGAPSGGIVVAERQSAGRGRLGRTWLSKQGDSLLFSYIARPALSAYESTLIPLAAGVATRSVIARWVRDVRIKWPNDVVVLKDTGVLKIAGILAESCMHGAKVEWVVIGVGINVAMTQFDSSVAHRATSIALEADRVPALTEVCVDLACALRDELALLEQRPREYTERWAHFDLLKGRSVRILDAGGKVEGVADGVHPDGRLRVIRTDGQLQLVMSGDATLHDTGLYHRGSQ